MKALIDGDMVVHMACAAQQVTCDLDDGNDEDDTFVDVEAASEGAMRMIHSWKRHSGCRSLVVCFSEGENFRKVIFPDYKTNRTLPKPEAYHDVKEAVELEYPCWGIPGLEADDIMGIAASRDHDYVMVSRDKDMMTVPGFVFNPDHHRRPVMIKRTVADQMWLRQTMTGDTVDGFKGIPKIGDTRAQKLLTKPYKLLKKTHTVKRGKNKGQTRVKWEKGPECGLWEAMVSHAEAAGMTESDLITQARLARILRTGEFDTDRRVVMLWHPSGKHEELKLDE